MTSEPAPERAWGTAQEPQYAAGSNLLGRVGRSRKDSRDRVGDCLKLGAGDSLTFDNADRRSSRWLPSFTATMLVCLAARVIVGVTTRPLIAPDTFGYMELARDIWHGNISAFQGIRTPGYSFFLLLHGLNVHAARVTQFALGMATVAGIFFVLWRLTQAPWLSSAGAVMYGLSVGHLFQESIVQTELLATFLLVAAPVLLVSLRGRDRHACLKLVALGVAVGVLPLVRPLYVYMPLLLAIPVATAVKSRPRRFWLYILPALIPVMIWMGYLGVAFNYFGLQTTSGFGWTNHAGAYMRDAPDRYASIRDIYLRQVEAQGGAWVDAIWHVIPEMQRATGQSLPELSKTVQRLSFGLLLTHPYGYSKQVLEDFVGFFKGGRISADWTPFGSLTWPLSKLMRYLEVVVNAWFCGVVVCLAARKLRIIRLPALPWPCFWLVMAVLTSGVVQALVERGSSERMGMPTFPFVIVVVMCSLRVWLLPSSGATEGAADSKMLDSHRPT